MWTQRQATIPHVDVAAERERVLARRAEAFREDEARKLLSHCGWDAQPEQLEELSRTKYAHLPLEERTGIVTRALELVRQEQQRQSEESPVIKAAGGPKLTPEQREAVRDLIRRELQKDPSAPATEVRRAVERELDITLNSATFHTTYWRKVKAEMESEATLVAETTATSPSRAEPSQNGADPSEPVHAWAEEQISLTPGPDGQWRVNVQVLTSRAQALRVMQAVLGVLAAEE